MFNLSDYTDIEFHLHNSITCIQQKYCNKVMSQPSFFALRVYRDLSTTRILNYMLCNRIMKVPLLVRNSPLMYNISKRMLGDGFTNMVIENMFCKMLTAGNSIEQADQRSQYFRKSGIAVILDYCAQGDANSGELEPALDANSSMFARTAHQLAKNKNEMISIKITGLLDMNLLRTYNNSIVLRNKFWKDNAVDGKLNGDQLLEGLSKIWSAITQDQAKEYLQKIHSHKGGLSQFVIEQLDFKINHHPYYIFDEEKNSNFVIRLFLPLDVNDKQKMLNFVRRINEICQPYAENTNNFKILVDAEQTYVQKGIQSISEQMQSQYNKNRLYIVPTIQNYLKSSVERSHYEIALALKRNLFFGAKLVRGAYIVEESRLAKQNGYQNPVVDCFDKTTQNYMNSFQAMIKGCPKGEIIVATHNKQTIDQTIRIKQKYSSQITVSFAQLLGLADHLTWLIRHQNYPVYKYLPWAKTQIMIPYMIRRAEQLSQMKYPLDTQFNLLKHELKARIVG